MRKLGHHGCGHALTLGCIQTIVAFALQCFLAGNHPTLFVDVVVIHKIVKFEKNWDVAV